MRKKKELLIIPNDSNLESYKCKSFILPLKGYSIGFDIYFDIDEINKFSSFYNVSVIINKFLHKDDLNNIKKELLKFNDNIKYFFIEDFSLVNYLPKEKIVLYPNHIISNYYSVNYLKELGFNNVTISNELTIDELKEINKNTNSNLFYTYLSKNNLMYSRRNLLTNYYENYDIDGDNNLLVNESVSNHELLIKEEDDGTLIFNNKIFCASKYLDDLDNYNLIINLSNIDNDTKKIIVDNLDNKDLYNLIDSDFYFLENKIAYKVGDLK